ncbi:MAG TPA: hypothetical protein VH227_01195 [Candidatus Udaeobacter sp.]|nr:hypothetical protein [Candidatus Udaeobacter sp.]
MRILLWHGYLLGGTGSNVYSRALAREWSRGGHEVIVVSQEQSFPILNRLEYSRLYLTDPLFVRKLRLFTGARSSTG